MTAVQETKARKES